MGHTFESGEGLVWL